VVQGEKEKMSIVLTALALAVISFITEKLDKPKKGKRK